MPLASVPIKPADKEKMVARHGIRILRGHDEKIGNGGPEPTTMG